MPTGRVSSYQARRETVQPQWFHVDADDRILGRLAAKIATVLNYPVSWAAPHIAIPGKRTWAEVAVSRCLNRGPASAETYPLAIGFLPGYTSALLPT